MKKPQLWQSIAVSISRNADDNRATPCRYDKEL